MALPEGAKCPSATITDDGLEDDLLDTRQLVMRPAGRQEERFTVSIVNRAGELLREVDVVAGPARPARGPGHPDQGRYAAPTAGPPAGRWCAGAIEPGRYLADMTRLLVSVLLLLLPCVAAAQDLGAEADFWNSRGAAWRSCSPTSGTAPGWAAWRS